MALVGVSLTIMAFAWLPLHHLVHLGLKPLPDALRQLFQAEQQQVGQPGCQALHRTRAPATL